MKGWTEARLWITALVFAMVYTMLELPYCDDVLALYLLAAGVRLLVLLWRT